MLKNGTLYQDLGPDHFDKRAQAKHVHRLIDRLRNLGFAVQITPVEAAA
jgi:transposase